MITEQDIERWTELVAAEARGERLTELESSFRAAIERERPELVAEAPLWRALGEHGAGVNNPGVNNLGVNNPGVNNPGATGLSDDELCAAALAGARVSPPIARHRAPRRLGPALALAAGLALAFGLYAILGATERPSRGEAALAPAAAPMTSVPRPESRVRTMTPGSRTRLAPAACVAVTDELDVCARTAADLELLASGDAIDLRLVTGAIEVFGADDPRPVSVDTPVGTFVGAGAVFTVALADDLGGAQVVVLAGEVDVRDPSGASESLAAGRARAVTRVLAPPEPREAPTLAPTDPGEAKPRPRPAIVHEVVASPEALLESAQQRLTAGDTARAIIAYETLLRHHPGSVEARTALVSLGNLLLLGGQPARALRHFDRYLAHGGELSEEALYGRINALQRQHRDAEAREASAQFLARHADSLYAPRVRALVDDGD